MISWIGLWFWEGNSTLKLAWVSVRLLIFIISFDMKVWISLGRQYTLSLVSFILNLWKSLNIQMLLDHCTFQPLANTNYFFLQLKEHRSLYESYVPMKYKQYYKKMAKYVSSVPVYILGFMWFLVAISMKFNVLSFLIFHLIIHKLQKWWMGRPRYSSGCSW